MGDPGSFAYEAKIRKWLSDEGFTKFGLETDEKGVCILDLLRADNSQLSKLKLKGLPLKGLTLRDSKAVTDISYLAGNRLICLEMDASVQDLTPLAGMPLKILKANNPGISDLSPLKGMPLCALNLNNTQVADISPLKGMPLNDLALDNTKVQDISPLRNLPLTHLTIRDAPISDLSPLEESKLTTLDIRGTHVTDVSVLSGVPLMTLNLDVSNITNGLAVLRNMPTLKCVNGNSKELILDQLSRQQNAK